MKIKLSFLCMAFQFITLSAQNVVQGSIVDKTNLKPLPYATIGSINHRFGTYTDTAGVFKLHYCEDQINDTIMVFN